VQVSLPALREVMAFGIGIHAKRLLDSAALNLDNLVVGRTIGIAGLGLYDKAFTTMNRAVLALSTIGPTVSFRIFAIIQDDTHRFRLAYRKVLLTATLIGYPALTWLVIVAPELFDVMFGHQWASAVIPFQILCGAGLMKLLIAYASAATQSKGRIWGEVWRQILVVAGVAAGSRWGLNGAAGGVLLATLVMAVLMHAFLVRVASLAWLDVITPQFPALVCSGVLVAALLMASTLHDHLVGASSSLSLLLLRAVTGLLTYTLFVLFCGFPEVRTLVDDTLNELAPWHKRWLRPAAR
jgi:PST family polysaccharide transporter